MKELKFHEKKLLKKVDFLDWKNDENIRETKIIRRYYIQNPSDLKR
jgi:U3 small nucleolar ribonucleoprotein protein IMP3